MLSRRQDNRQLFFPNPDIKETDKEMQIYFPGLSQDDFKFDVDEDNHRLIISSKKDWSDRNDHESEFLGDPEYHEYRESHQSFERQFSLPQNVKKSDIQTGMDNGSFKIIIPK